MLKLFRPIFKSVWSYKEAKILLGFSLFPLIHALMTVFSLDFIAIQTLDNYKTTYFDYASLMMTVLYNIAAPGVVLAFLVSKVFKSDFEQRIYTLYKDLDRKNIFIMKLLSILLILILFFVSSFTTSFIAFYTKIGYLENSSLDIFGLDWNVSLVSLVGFFVMFLVITSLSSLISLKKNSGSAMLMTIIVMLASSILSFVGKVAYFIPVAYKDLLDSVGLVPALLAILGLGIVYYAIPATVSLKYFQEMEF